MTLYFLSGLGADRRIFEKIHLPVHHKIVYIDWVVPQKKESIHNYARRLSAHIDPAEPFCIVGLSFGGMMAIELSKIVSPRKTILISSIASSRQRPWYFQILRIFPVYKLFSQGSLKMNPSVTYKMMGVTNNEEKAVFNTMLEDTDITFFKWAIESILKWEQPAALNNIYQIHGTADLMFPIKYIKTSYMIPKGNHLMVYTKAEEVSRTLAAIIAD